MEEVASYLFHVMKSITSRVSFHTLIQKVCVESMCGGMFDFDHLINELFKLSSMRL